MEAADIKKSKDIEDVNRLLKQMFAILSLGDRAQRVVWELDSIVANHGYPLKMRIDNGPELIAG